MRVPPDYLARIMHALSAAQPGSSALTTLPTLGRNALSARRCRLFASTTRELSGLDD